MNRFLLIFILILGLVGCANETEANEPTFHSRARGH